MRSHLFVFFARSAAKWQAASQAIQERNLVLRVPDVTENDPELQAGFQATPAAPFSQGYLFLGSQSEVILGR